MDRFSREKLGEGSSNPKKSSRNRSHESKSRALSVKEQADLFSQNEYFVSTVKSLKAVQLCLDEEYNHKNSGIEALQTDLEETSKKLKKLLEDYSNKLVTIQQNTTQKKHLLESLESTKKEIKSGAGMTSDIVLVWKEWLDNDDAREKRRAARHRPEMEQVRYHNGREVMVRVRNMMTSDYNSDWFRLSSVDKYCLEKYGFGGYNIKDTILGKDGMQEKLEKHILGLLKKIKWHRSPKRDSDWENRIRTLNLSTQEVGRIG